MDIEARERLVKVLKLVAPGTLLREGLDHITQAMTGALIVVSDPNEIADRIDGGFTLNADFLPTYLYELAKMDGAIVISSDFRRVLFANVQLLTDPSLPSFETGIRHRVAERFSRETGKLVIAISQRRGMITLYFGTGRYVMRDVGFILTKANQAIQTLARYRATLDRALTNLTALEFEDLVTVLDVASALHRTGLVLEVENEIHLYIAELGSEGRMVTMQMEELTSDVATESMMLIRDYVQPNAHVDEVRRAMLTTGRDGLSDRIGIGHALGYGGGLVVSEQMATPSGYRILRKIPRLPLTVIDNLVRQFGGLPEIMAASLEELDQVEGIGEVRARSIREGLRRLRDQALMDRHL